MWDASVPFLKSSQWSLLRAKDARLLADTQREMFPLWRDA